MTTKRRALKALVILLVVLGLSMFLSRTVQTITTAKVQRVQASRGRLEEKIPVKGEVRFSQAEGIAIPDASKLAMTFDKVLIKPGYRVEEGDLVLTAKLATFDEEVAKVKEDYDKKVRELTVEVAGHIRLPQESEHNRYYNDMLRTTDVYYDKLYAAQALAVEAKQTLPEDVATWGVPSVPATAEAQATQTAQLREEGAEQSAPEAVSTPAPTASPEGSPAPATPDPTKDPQVVLQERLKATMQEAYDAKVAMDQATGIIRSIYKGTGPVARTGDALFDYIKKTDGLREDIAKLSEKLLALSELKNKLQNAHAPRAGWVVSVAAKEGEKYEGDKAVYSLSLPGEMPVLRCDITNIKKNLQVGMTATLDGSNVELTISEIVVNADGTKQALIPLNQESITALGGLSKLMAGQQDVTIQYRSQRNTTLIPASALRTSGEETYVYVIQQSYGGMLSNATFTVKKQTVKVIETSQSLVALEDDLSYMEIADREDRPIADGQTVMSYVD